MHVIEKSSKYLKNYIYLKNSFLWNIFTQFPFECEFEKTGAKTNLKLLKPKTKYQVEACSRLKILRMKLSL